MNDCQINTHAPLSCALQNFNSYRQCLMKGGQHSCGWETIYHLYNVLMSRSDAGSLSKGCHSDGGAVLESWPHKPESKPHTSPEVWCVTTGLQCGMQVTLRSKSTTPTSVISRITALPAAGNLCIVTVWNGLKECSLYLVMTLILHTQGRAQQLRFHFPWESK